MYHKSLLDLGTYTPSRRTTLTTVLCASGICFLVVGCVLGVLTSFYMRDRELSNRTMQNHVENNRTLENHMDVMDNDTMWMVSTGKWSLNCQ